MANKTSKRVYWILKALEVVLAVLPLFVLVLVRHEKYIYSNTSAWELSAGAVIALIVIAGTIMKKLHLSGIAWSIILLIMSWFLRALIDDLQLIFLCLTIGLIFSKAAGFLAGEEKERVQIERSAKKSAEYTKAAIQELQGDGRV